MIRLLILIFLLPIFSFAQSPFMIQKGNTLVYDVIENSKQQTLSIFVEELTPSVKFRFVKNKKDAQLKVSDSLHTLLKIPKKFGAITDPSVLYMPKEMALTATDSSVLSMNAYGKNFDFVAIFKGKLHIPVRGDAIRIPYDVWCHIVVINEFEQDYVHTYWYHEEQKIPLMLAYTSKNRTVRLREVF